MKKILGIMLVGLFLVAGNVYANCGKCGVGDTAHGEDMSAMVDERVSQMSKDLELNDEQKGKVAAIMKEKMEKKHQIMDEKHTAMDALHEDFQTKLKGVLSEEQFKKWEEKKAHGHCPECKDGKMCDKCKAMKKDHCPECKDGKMCDKCKAMKKDHCPECKDGKMCPKCEKMSKGDCPDCKDGKMCKMCKIKKAKEGKDRK